MGRTEFSIGTRLAARRREIAENVAAYPFAAAPRSRRASTIGAMSAAARISTPPARTRDGARNRSCSVVQNLFLPPKIPMAELRPVELNEIAE